MSVLWKSDADCNVWRKKAATRNTNVAVPMVCQLSAMPHRRTAMRDQGYGYKEMEY